MAPIGKMASFKNASGLWAWYSLHPQGFLLNDYKEGPVLHRVGCPHFETVKHDGRDPTTWPKLAFDTFSDVEAYVHRVAPRAIYPCPTCQPPLPSW